MKILAFCGPSGSGKDTLGDWINEREGGIRFGFSDYPKKLVSELLSLPLSSFYSGKNLPSPYFWKDLVYLETKIPDRYEPNRRLLHREIIQKFSEFFRKMNPRVWAKRLTYKIDEWNGEGILTINDLRFWEELHQLKDYGAKIIRLTRCKDVSAWREHISEKEWKEFPVDVEIDNQNLTEKETIEVLEKKVKEWTVGKSW